MISDILGHFFKLHRFGGRERVASFWIYAGCVFGLMLVATSAVFMPEMARSMARMQQFAREHPESATVSQGPGHYELRIEGNHPELMPNFEALLGGMTAIMLVSVLLLAAAVTRRLHDSGRTGAWGLLPLPFLVAGFALMPRMFSFPMDPDMGLFALLFANNFIYLCTLALLAYLLSKPTDPAENRYGPPSA